MIDSPLFLEDALILLEGCRCERLCLNQSARVLAAQTYPLLQQLRSPRVCPRAHRCWRVMRSGCRRYLFWVSTVRVMLSSAYTSEVLFDVVLGLSSMGYLIIKKEIVSYYQIDSYQNINSSPGWSLFPLVPLSWSLGPLVPSSFPPLVLWSLLWSLGPLVLSSFVLVFGSLGLYFRGNTRSM